MIQHKKVRGVRRRRRGCLAGIVIILIIICAGIQFGPQLLLFIIGFRSSGNVEDYFSERERNITPVDLSSDDAILGVISETRVSVESTVVVPFSPTTPVPSPEVSPTRFPTSNPGTSSPAHTQQIPTQVSQTSAATTDPSETRTIISTTIASSSTATLAVTNVRTSPTTSITPQEEAVTVATSTTPVMPTATSSPTPTVLPKLALSYNKVPSRSNVFAFTFRAAGFAPVTFSSEDENVESVSLRTIENSEDDIAIIRYREQSAVQLCNIVIAECETDRYRIDFVDFRIDGFIVYGSTNLGFFGQQIGVVMLLGEERNQLQPIGIVYEEELFEIPEDGQVRELIDELTTRGNETMSTLEVDILELSLDLSAIYVDNSTLVLVFD